MIKSLFLLIQRFKFKGLGGVFDFPISFLLERTTLRLARCVVLVAAQARRPQSAFFCDKGLAGVVGLYAARVNADRTKRNARYAAVGIPRLRIVCSCRL